MNTMTQYQHEHEHSDRRAKFRAENTTICPNCGGVHVEQGEFVESGHTLLPWHNHSQAYAAYAYTCQSCSAEFIAGSTERYFRQHHEIASPTAH